MAECQSYRLSAPTCADGFVQTSFCLGVVGCPTCGRDSGKAWPRCVNEDSPLGWMREDGLPLGTPIAMPPEAL